jgi:zinc protease
MNAPLAALLFALTLPLTMVVPMSAEAADAPLPKNLPAYGAERSLPPLQIAQKTLSNGLTVWVLPRNDGPPKVHFVLAVRGGLAADDFQHPGFAQLLAQLMKEGTAMRDSRRVAEDLQSYGAEIEVEAGNDGIVLTASGLASNAAKLITLLSEIALQPAFPPNEVDLAKLNAVQALHVAKAEPGYLAQRALVKLVYGEHPYGHTFATDPAILSVSPQMLHAEHARRFRPDSALLVIGGRIDKDAAFVMAERVFGDWRAEGKPLPATAAAPATMPAARAFVEREGSVQSAIRIGRPAIAADSPDYFPLTLANAVLGGGFSSRLNQNLREEKGYTYGAGSAFAAQRAGGSLIASANVRNDVTGAAIGEFDKELARLGSEPVSAAELDQTKRYMAGGYLLLNQSLGNVLGTLADFWLVGLPPQTLSDYVPKIQAVTAAQVQAMGRKYFAPEQQSIVVVGDAGVRAQLKPYGEFPLPDKDDE